MTSKNILGRNQTRRVQENDILEMKTCSFLDGENLSVYKSGKHEQNIRN